MENSLSSSNARKYSSSNPLKRILLDRFLAHLSLCVVKASPESILDVGCGEGFVASLLRNALPGVEYVGIDVSEGALIEARKINSSTDFRVASVDKLPFEDNAFDMAICIEVLEHLEHPYVAVLEICRVARRVVVFSVPHEPFFQIGNLLGLSHLNTLGNPPDHLNHWNVARFKAFLSQFVDIRNVETSFPWQILTTAPRASAYEKDDTNSL